MAIDAFTKSMLGLTTGLQATGLAMSNLPGGTRKRKRKGRRNGLIGQGVTNIAGIGMIGAQSDIIAGL